MNQRKKVLISGASSGIGRATALRFAAEGYDVCLTALVEAELEAARAELAPGDHLVCAGDYSDPATSEAIGALVRERWGKLDALVSCAGVYMQADAIEAPMVNWRRPFDIMMNGAVLLTRMAVPLMSEGGRVVHVTSIHGTQGESGTSAYGMVKAAINQYCRVLCQELAPRGILVNAIAPGFVETPMSYQDGETYLNGEWFRQNYVEGHHLPLKRAAQPSEVAGVAWFLCGPDATYITGQIITVDGGLTATF